jgi:hypothetical protein
MALNHGTTMNFVVGCLLWPVAVFLNAVAGVLRLSKTPKVAMYQKLARLALFGSVVVFSTLPLSLIAIPTIGIKPPLALGVVLLLVFVVIGNLCDDQTEDRDAEHGFPRARS